jgi:DNA-binding response OmpR family regulator
MPLVSGLDVLRWARQQTGLMSPPIIMLTSSEGATDVALAYKLGANSFVVKPFEREERVRHSTPPDGDQEVSAEVLTTGATALLRKPFSQESLLGALRSALAKPEGPTGHANPD